MEFLSWVDWIQGIAAAPADMEDVTPLLTNDTSYFVATLTLLSPDSSLGSWLRSYPTGLDRDQYFKRKVIETMWNRFGVGNSVILPRSTNAMLTVMPQDPGYFYSGKILRSKDWEYL